MFFALKVVVWIEMAMIAGWFLWRHAAAREFRGLFDQRHLWLILAIPFIAFLTPTVELIHLIAIALVPLFARNREEAVSIFILCLFLFPELGRDMSIGPLYLLTVTLPMSLTIGLGVAYILRPGPAIRVSKPVLAAVIVFSALLFVSALRNGGLPMRPAIDFLLRIILPFLLIASMLTTREAVRRAMASMLLAGVCLAFLAIIESSRNWPIYQEVYRVHGIPLTFSSALQVRGGVMRAPTTFLESTTFAILLTMCAFALIWLKGIARSAGWKTVMIGLFVLAMLAAVSRGAFLGLAIGLFAGLLFRKRYAQAATTIVGSAFGLLILRALSPYNSFLSGIFNTTSVSGEADFRVDLWNAGVEIVRQYPLTGLPTDAVLERLAFLRAGGIVDFVNTYLFFTMTGGIGGLIAFASVIVIPAIVLLLERKRFDKAGWDEATVVFSMSGALFFLFFFTSYYERNPYWLVLAAGWSSALVNGVPSVKKQSAATPRRTVPSVLPSLA